MWNERRKRNWNEDNYELRTKNTRKNTDYNSDMYIRDDTLLIKTKQ